MIIHKKSLSFTQNFTMQKVADLLFTKEILDKKNLLNYKQNKKWKSFSGQDFYEQVFKLAAYLDNQGIKKNDKVLLVSENRPEWNFTDYACQLIGAVTIPVFPNISEHDLNFILEEALPKIAFISREEIFRKYQPLLEKHLNTNILSFSENE